MALGNMVFDSLVTVIPKSEHETPEVKESKQAELNGWLEFGAKMDVPINGQRF